MGLCNILLLVLVFAPVPLWIILLNNYNYYLDYLISSFQEEPPVNFVYDFIVVGAGSAGAVVANRLSKNENNQVLLLEAGGDPIFLHKIPALAGLLLHWPQHDWLHETVPQKHAMFGSPNHVSKWPRGKALGGSSNLNYMMYARGHPLDYDNWANLTGDSSWNYENVLPYFKKSIDYHGDYVDNEKHYGQSAYGPMHVENRQWRPMDKEFLAATQEIGYDVTDLNGPQRTGFAPIEVTQKNGYRHGTYSAFIEPILARKNLHILRYSQGVKIKLDKSNRAEGVYYIRRGGGTTKFARARKEVIICAGAIDSPKLLMLSGIGPKKHLRSVGIKLILDLPVGQNLADHPMTVLPNIVIDKPLSFNPERDFNLGTLTEFIFNGTGMLTSPASTSHQGFFSSSTVQKTGVDWPDLQMYHLPNAIYSMFPSDFEKVFGIKYGYWDSVVKTIYGHDAFSLVVVLVRPKSIGELTLRDVNPLSKPLIDPHYLEEPQDVKALQDGIQVLLNIVEKSKTYQGMNARLTSDPLLGCDQHPFRSSEYWECYIRHMTLTVYHPVGTCRMGTGVKDSKAVLDTRLRVLHTRGLRVADASIMPVIVNGNTNAPTIMIGEKAADFIREFWSKQYSVCPASRTYDIKHEFELNRKLCFYSQLS